MKGSRAPDRVGAAPRRGVRMTCAFAIRMICAVVLCSACTDSAAPIDASTEIDACIGEFFDGVVAFSDGTTQQACARAATRGFVVNRSPILPCPAVAVAATGYSSDAGPTWTVGSRGGWFGRVGPAVLSVRYAPGALGDRSFASDGCEFDVTAAALRDGEMVEASLTAPCTLRRTSTSGGPPELVLTSMRFRAHLSDFDLYDGGPCRAD